MALVVTKVVYEGSWDESESSELFVYRTDADLELIQAYCKLSDQTLVLYAFSEKEIRTFDAVGEITAEELRYLMSEITVRKNQPSVQCQLTETDRMLRDVFMPMMERQVYGWSGNE